MRRLAGWIPCRPIPILTGVITVGTSGFSFEDWAVTVYPGNVSRDQWLPYYERVLGFRALELNSTFYTLINAPTIQRMIARTTPNFRFVVKAHQSLTHGPCDGRVLDRFRGTVDLFRAAGRFAGTLAQFPPSFAPTPATLLTLNTLHAALGDPLFVEFRNPAWSLPASLDYLRGRRFSYVIPDLPRVGKLPRLSPVVTAPPAYLRLHGRNPGWFSTSTMDRYNYAYSDEELRELTGVARRLEKEAGDVMVFFNNCRRGHAALDARRLAAALGPAAA